MVSLLGTNRMHEIERPTYIKDAPRRVFDTHVHYPWRPRGSKLPIYTADGMLDMLAYNSQRLNIYKVCLLGRPGEGNDLVEKALERYPNLIVPFAMIDIDQTDPTDDRRLRRSWLSRAQDHQSAPQLRRSVVFPAVRGSRTPQPGVPVPHRHRRAA